MVAISFRSFDALDLGDCFNLGRNEKKELIAKISSHKLRKQFFLGTGNNSLNENIDLIRYGMEYDFREFLIMPPAYYKGNTDEGVFEFYSRLIK